MKKLIAMFTLVLLAGAGCASNATVNTTGDATHPNTGTVTNTNPNGQDVDSPTGSMNDNDVDDTTTNIDVTAGDDSANVDVATSPVKEFTITGGNFKFTPSAMTVKKGDTVRVTFKNEEGFHDFRIDEFNVATKQIGAGTSETVEFVADKAGTFEYYCSVGQHRQMGMVGTLTVTE